jgi:class 3 adenylate cyclase/tetratricopeptide (TPR) repeat protein
MACFSTSDEDETMKCSTCGFNNQPGMKFCGECGAALLTAQPDVTCASCGHINRAVSQYCANCGTKLNAEAENKCPNCGHLNRAIARVCAECGFELTPRSAVKYDERRIVTIIFGDIAGFTAMSEQLDPEEVKQISSTCFARLSKEVADYDGHVDKYLGDNIMVLFGAPIAHEDDAERAVRCALEMQRAVRSLSETLEREMAAKHGLHFNLELHIGINTGEVMAGIMGGNRDQDYTVMGDAVNLASRLQHAADPGKILVGQLTFQATHEAVEYREKEPLKVRGKQMPVPVWEVIGLRSQRDRLRSSIGLEAPMVGRASQFSRLKALYQTAVEQRKPVRVVVYGEAGMGKSRFLLEFEKYAEGLPQQPSFRKGRCLPYGEGVSYWALTEMIKSECNILDDDPAKVKYNKLSARVRELYDDAVADSGEQRQQLEREVREVAQMLAYLLGVENTDSHLERRLDPQSMRDGLFLSLRRFFERKAQQAPLVLAFEDIHWADESLVEFLDYLTETATAAPILLICLARPQLQEKQPRWAAHIDPNHRITLNKLSESDSGEVIDELLKRAEGAEMPAHLRENVIATAEGNPFYIEETVRILLDQGALSGSDDVAEGAAVRIPTTIQGLIGARIDRLGLRADGKEDTPDSAGMIEKRALQAAAVVGRIFWQGAVARLLNGAGNIEAVLRALQKKDFIIERNGSRFTGEREYSFRSILTRDVAYNTLPKLRRGEWHSEVASWIEAKAGRRSAQFVELLAYHFEEAARLEFDVLSLSNSATDDENTAKAIRYLQEAGDRERARQNIRAATSLYQRAIARAEAGDNHPPGYLQLLCSYAEMLEVLGRYDEALKQLDEVSRLAIQQGSELDHACALSQTAEVYQAQGRLSEAEQLANQALQLYEQAGDRRGAADALRVLGKVALGADQMDKGQDYFRRLYALCADLGDRSGQARALYQMGEVCFYRNQSKQCIWFVQEAQQIFNTLGNKRQVAVCMLQLAAVYIDLAEYQRAEGYEQQAHELLTALGDRHGVARSLTGLTRIYYQQGRLNLALTTVQQALAMNREIGSAASIAWSLRERGRVNSALGEWDKAAQAYNEALQLSDEFKLMTVRAELYRGLAEVAVGRKDADMALHYLAQGLAGLPDDDYYSQASLLRVQGQALALQGDAAAEQSLVQSIETLEQHKYPADLALSCRTYAEFLSEHGHDSEARSWQAKADAVLREAHIRDSSESPTQMLPVTATMAEAG